MAATNDKPPVNTRVLFSLKDLGIDQKFIKEDRITMESEKYICVRETNSVVIIDMTKPTQPIRLSITADSAIMNPDAPILAFKVEAKIDETTCQDQLRIYDINTKTISKSCNIAEKVECWKWISPKLLGLVTLKVVYHWSIQDSTGPVKMLDVTDKLATSKITGIRNFIHDPSGKWFALMGYRAEDNKTYFPGLVRPYQGGDQWFNFSAHAAAFTTFNEMTLHLPYSVLSLDELGMIKKTRYIELSVSDGFDLHQGRLNIGKKRLEFDITGANSYVQAIQISQKYGLMYVITWHGLISIHDLETAEDICCYNMIDYKTSEDAIIRTTEVPSSESFYAINKKGQVLLISVNDSTILSYESDKLLLTRGKLHDLQRLCREKSKESDVLNNQKAELQKSQQQMLVEIEGLKLQNNELKREREKLMRNPEEICFMVQSNNLVENFREFTEAELGDVTNDFNDSQKIGEGERGSVYKAFLGLKPIAIKILKHECHNGGSEFNQEVSISSRLRHPNLVMLLGACTEKQALIYELMPNGSLHDILRNKNQSIVLTWKKRIHIASDICSGLIYLDSAKPYSIVHGNLKPTNILLDYYYTAKLTDFGTRGHLHPKDTVDMPHDFTIYPKGALPYIDPEYFSTNELTTQSDVYSFGIVLLELVSGRDPMGLRKSVKDALRKGEHFVDATAGEWPFEEAKRMVLLGLQCSDPSAENRPDLVNEVLVQIESMRLASLRF